MEFQKKENKQLLYVAVQTSVHTDNGSVQYMSVSWKLYLLINSLEVWQFRF